MINQFGLKSRFSDIKFVIPEVLALVVLNLCNDAITLNVHLILLDPRLPVLAFAVPGHPLLMLAGH